MEEARTWLPRGLGCVVFLWYGLAAAPGFYWLDSAELSASAIGLGSPHPTGFPLYLLLAKLSSLLPIGELAFRINLLSSLCAAVAVAGVARLIIKISGEDWSGLAGAAAGSLALAASLLFARQATVAEVYAPTAAWIVVTLLLFERVARGAPAAVGLSLAWVAGLGFGFHPSYRLLLGPPILVLLSIRLYRGARWPLLTPMVTSLAALAMYLYLPVRSATGRIASLDWGHPNDFDGLLAHANASEVRAAFADRMMSGTGEIVRHDAATFARQLGDHLGLLCVLAGCAGLVVLFRERKSRWVAGALAAIAASDAVYGAWINPMGLVDLQNGVPLVLCVCIFAGAAVAALARQAGPASPFVGAALVVIVVLPSALVTVPAVAEVGDLPRAVGEEALTPLRPGAVLLTQSDSLAAATIYLSTVEGARPDVAPLVLSMLSDRQRVAEVINISTADAGRLPPPSSDPLATIFATGRAIYWENGERSPPRDSSVRLGALVSEVEAGAPRALTRGTVGSLERIFAQDGHRDRVARRVFAHALTNLGRAYFARGKFDEATLIFERALQVRSEHAAARVNLGVILSRAGRLEEAASATERALEDEPNRARALINAARYRMSLGQLDRAEKHAARVVRVAPKNASAWNIAGLVDLKANRQEEARANLRRALELAPQHREARAALGTIPE